MNITLKTPIKRGDTTIESVQVRKPIARELAGSSLVALLQMDVGALVTILPRITVPNLIEQELEGLDPADMMALGATVCGFLLPTTTTKE